MPKETLGYVKLEWTCPNCGSRNPGPQKTCGSCGAAQPEDVEFEQPAQEQLIANQEDIARAKAGPDVHCAFCGARNPAGAETCTQCGADLTDAEARASGQVTGAHRDKPAKPVPCPSCSALNPATALECSQCGASMVPPRPESYTRRRAAVRPSGGSCSPIVWVVLGGIVLLGAVLFFLSTRTEEMVGRVEDVSWSRVIAIEALEPVTYEDWHNEIPSDAVIGTCVQRIHHTQDQPAANAQKVCGTPYTVDTGSGYGQVVQDCQYQVSAEWCKYEVKEWQEVDKVTISGNDLKPRWPVPQLGSGQREGTRQESYQILFDVNGKNYTYRTSDETKFTAFEIGGRWVLKVNTFNAVTSVDPAD